MGKLKAVGLILLISAILLAGGFKLWRVFQPSEAPGILIASGRIEGRITTLTPKSSGWVVEIKADEGQTVSKGSVLAVLDDEAQRERIRGAEENLKALSQRLSATETQLAILRKHVPLEIKKAIAALGEERAKIKKARAIYEQAKKDAQRYSELAAKNLVSQQKAEHEILRASVAEKELTEAMEAKAKAESELAQARLGEQEIDAKSAERDALTSYVAQAEAILAEQQSYLKDFIIRSPLDGTILTRTLELGERVNIGTPLFSLVDLNQLYLKVYIPEPDIGKVALGQEARVYVDAYPDRAFPARVSKVAQQAEFTPKNVETKGERVKLVFAIELSLMENPGGVLKPGMPADGVIRWQKNAEWIRP